ncbi:hypothetical protein DQM68_15575 [Leptospira mayottensis]|nr:hypothetical protein DQM68_15575 [Leptospira mayottensis]AZQ01665.1 hypothetical protein LEP1GSC190_06145 [Leptospira mayottensis 200901116]TGM95363.1 hypothetical protein EHR03_17000 [Leptospira mayottensis]
MLSSWEIELLNNTFLRVVILNYYFDSMRRRRPFWEQKWITLGSCLSQSGYNSDVLSLERQL